MRVMVTGSRGFIGSAVVREIESRGWEVVRFDLPNDVRQMDDLLLGHNGADTVIHLAGVLGTHELFDAPRHAVDVNVHGTLNVLELCKLRRLGYVGITMPPVFPSIYTATKMAATRLASAYHHSHGVPVSHVRAFNAFGPGQAHGPGHPQKILPTFAVHSWAGRPIPIWGDGLQTVDLIHTSDLARLLVDATLFHDDQVLDGGTGEPFSVVTIADMVNVVTGSGVPHEHLPMRRGEVPTHIVASGEGWHDLDWEPRFRHTDFIDSVESYRDWESHA